MTKDKTDQYEQAIVLMLNFDGWDLEWCGLENTFYDAKVKHQRVAIVLQK